MGNQSRPQEDGGGMSGKGMQEAGRKGWEGERAARHNGAAAFINPPPPPPPQCGTEEGGEDGEMDSGSEGGYRKMGEQGSKGQRSTALPKQGGGGEISLAAIME